MSEDKLTKEQWFEKFSVDYMKTVKGAAYYFVKNQEWAEDIIQDIYCRVWKYGDIMMTMEQKAMEAYLKKIIRSAVADYFRDRNSQLILKDHTEITKLYSLKNRTLRAATESGCEKDCEEYLSMFREIKDKDRRLLTLRLVYNMAYKDIADALNMRPETARKRYERVMKRIKKYKGR